MSSSDSSGITISEPALRCGSRTSIAGYTLVNTPANLTKWIRDPQHVKPGTKMPKLPLSNGDVDTLVTYLEALR